jgi:hypothetical protein
MTYKTLLISMEELTDMKNGLDFVYQEMHDIKEIRDRINSLIGDPDPDLKGAVHSFESSWDDNRKDIVDSAQKMRDGTAKVIEDWTSWDEQNAKNLSQGRDGDGNPTGGK